MIIQCNSCNKKFVVPDSAITSAGRLVQCSSCGNKWTQHPHKETDLKNKEKIVKIEKKPKTKKIIKPKREIALYSTDYLEKKHGLKIKNTSSNKNKNANNKINKINFGFYNYLISVVIFFIFIYGFLSLTKEIIIFNYPFFESYLNYLFETTTNFAIILKDIISDY